MMVMVFTVIIFVITFLVIILCVAMLTKQSKERKYYH